MDILVVNGVAAELFADGAPELHPSLIVVRGYEGEVQEGWEYDPETNSFSEPVVEEIEETPEETFTTTVGYHLDQINDWQKGRIARGYIHTDENIYDCDLTSLLVITKLADNMEANGITETSIKLKNNQFVDMNAAEVRALADGINDYIQEVYAGEAAARKSLRAAMASEDIDVVKAWTIGA